MSAALAFRPRTQRGAVLAFATVGMLALIAIAGLALDMGHVYLNKTRVQNSVDAAALAAAKVLDMTRDTAQATTAAWDSLNISAGGPGNSELESAIDSNTAAVTIEFSDTLIPFVPGGANPLYARVRISNFDLEPWLIQVLGFTEKTVAASAVAGPSPVLNQVCNVAPMMACGDPTASAPWYGFEPGTLTCLKSGSQSSAKCDSMSPGNFQLIRLDGGQGGNEIRHNMAGSYERCLSLNEDIETEPGNTVGPVAQGLNTRFGKYQGGMGSYRDIYKPDYVTDYGAGYGFSNYKSAYSTGDWDYPDPSGEPERRVLVVPIGDCTQAPNGQGTVPLLGLGCFFLTEPASHTGSQEVYGEFIGGCAAAGTPGPNPGAGPGPYIIQLYKDPDSQDS